MNLFASAPLSRQTQEGAKATTSLIPLIVGAGLLSFVVSYSMHLANVRMHQEGIASFEIGLSVALQGLGIFLFAQIAGAAAARLGVRTVMVVGAALCCASMLMMHKLNTFVEWAAVRLILAPGIALLLTGSEFLVLRRCKEKNRIPIISAYATSVAAGTILGSYLLAVVGAASSAPFTIGAVLFCMAAIPAILWSREPTRDQIEVTQSVFATIRLVPLAFLAAFLFGVLDNGVLSLLAVFGVRSGYDVASAASLVAAAGIGAVAIQYPLARLCGRKGSLFALRFSAVAAVGGLALLPFGLASPAIAWANALVVGGLIEGLYTLALIHLAQRFGGSQLSSANACFISVCALGEVVGPAFTGISMDYLGPTGLILAGVLALSAFVIAIDSRKVLFA